MVKEKLTSKVRVIQLDIFTFTIAFGLANVISYAYIVIAGRTLSSEEFGLFNTLLGMIAIWGLFASSMQLAVAQAVAFTPTRPALTTLMRDACRIAIPSIVLLTVLAAPFASAIGASKSQIAYCGIVALMIFLACTTTGFLIGMGKVRTQVCINLLGTVVQLVIGWHLMSSGLGIIGALFGYLSNYAAITILAYWISWKRIVEHSCQQTVGNETPPHRLHAASLATYVLAFCPFNLDQLLVQWFAPMLGGNYAALVTMTKPVFFSAYPIIAVAYPHLLRLSNNRSRLLRLVIATAGAVICMAGFFALAAANFPGQLNAIVFSNRYPGVVPYVGSLAFGVACFSISVLGSHMLIAIRSPLSFLPSLATVIIQIVLFIFRHDSLEVVISNQLWTYGIQLILILAFIVFAYAKSLKYKKRNRLNNLEVR